MTLRAALLALTASACGVATKAVPAPARTDPLHAAAPSAAPPASSPPAAPSAAATSPSASARVPLSIRGYPKPLSTGMADYATWVGWSPDGNEVVACGLMTPIGPAKGAEDADTCFVRGRTGGVERLSLSQGKDDTYVVGPALAAKLAVVRASTENRLRFDAAAAKLYPPPLSGTWPYADVHLAVDDVRHGDDEVVLRIGGNVDGQADVYPITLGVVRQPGDVHHRGAWNAILAHDDELAFVGHFFCMEWCNDVRIERYRFGQLASLVYNDTGVRVHQTKDFARARDLFLRAVSADPEAKLPPYNLACAYARLGDRDDAEKTLRTAIALGGEGVKARAAKDEDFAAVRAEPWFIALTR